MGRVCQEMNIFSKKLRFVQNLHMVGEAGTVKIKTDTTPKLDDRSVHCIFVGYSLTHPADCFWMYDPKTHRVPVLHDIVWLHRMFYEKPKSVEEMVTD